MRSKSIIQDIVAKEFPGSKIRDFERLSGDAKETFLVKFEEGNKVIVNFLTKNNLEERFEVEDFIIQKVSQETDLPVAKVIASDLSREKVSYPYFVTTVLEGYNPTNRFKYLPTNYKKTILNQAVKYLGKLHRDVKLDEFGKLSYELSYETTGKELSLDRGSWPEVFMEIMERQFDEFQHDLYKELIPIAREKLHDNLDLIKGDFQPVLVHQDYGPRNILVKRDNITGIVDWERAISGHKEYDLFKAEKRFIDDNFRSRKIRESLRKEIFKGYRGVNSLEEGWRERRKFYRYSYVIESMWTFHIWSSELNEEVKENVQNRHTQYIEDGLGSSADWIYRD